MARNNVIDGLILELQQVSGFGPDSGGTAIAYDHRVLNSGIDRAAIVLADTWKNNGIAIRGKSQIDYSLSIEVYIRHNTDVVQARQDADIYVGNIIQRVNDHHTLSGSAFVSNCDSGRVEDEKMVIGNTPWLLESITIVASEILDAA